MSVDSVVDFLSAFNSSSRPRDPLATIDYLGQLVGPTTQRYASSLIFSTDQSQRSPSEVHTTSSVSSVSQIFDDQRSFYSTSTAPPRRGPPPIHHQRPGPPTQMTQPYLPCEFHPWDGCRERFPLHEVEAWINHIVTTHLHEILPTHTICWFCDDIAFIARSKDVEVKEDCYRARMHHIASHIQHGMPPTARRKDFHFLDHVNDNKLIGQDIFEREIRQGELSERGVRICTIPPPPSPRDQRFTVTEDSRRDRRREAKADRERQRHRQLH